MSLMNACSTVMGNTFQYLFASTRLLSIGECIEMTRNGKQREK